MSHSKRTSPCRGIAGGSHVSEKQHKRISAKKVRATVRAILSLRDDDLDATTFPEKPRDVRNPWAGEKDGKTWFSQQPRFPYLWAEGEWEELLRKMMRK